MKPSLTVRRLLLASTLLATANSAHAQLYWDTNGNEAGFGTASGTWGTDAFWNSDSSGGAGAFSTATTNSDSINFGTATDGLAEGTITVDGTVDSGNMTFGSASDPITLSGGTINFAAASIIAVNNTSNAITSAISGAGTSLTKAGTGALVLSGGGTMAGNLIVAGGTVQLGANNGISTNAGLQIFGSTSATRVLDLNGYDQTVSKLVFTTLDSPGNLTVTGGANSKLTITTTTDTEIGAGGSLSASSRPVTLDMSGLGEFEWSGSANIFRVGLRVGVSNASGTNPGTMTALLADTNTITAATLGIATQAASNNGGTGILRMGQTNTFNITNINIGASGRSNATLNFRDGLAGTPTVTIRGTDGTAPVTLWEIGRVTHTANSTWTSTADFSAGEVDAKVTTLRMGSANTTTQTGRAGTVNATFTMGKGSLEVGTLIIGQYASGTNGTVASSGTFAGNGIFNLNDATGIVKAGDIILADNIGLATGGTNRTTSGTFNLAAGTLEAKSIDRGANTGNATATTRNFNFTSGTLRNATGFDLAIANVPLNLTGSGTRIFEATAGQSITVASTSVISGTDQGFTKSGDGALILAASNTYSGATLISAGTLEVQGSIASSSSITNDSALVFNSGSAQSYVNGISGSGNLTKSGGGIFSLGGTNTYSGATNVEGGALQINSTGALNGTSQINLGTTTGTSLRFNVNNLTINTPIHTANSGQTSSLVSAFNTGNTSTPAVTNLGQISGDGNVIFTNVPTATSNLRHTFNLNVAGNYAGNTTITSDGGQNTIVNLGVANALPTATVLTLANGGGSGSGRQTSFNLNGHSQTLAGLASTSPGSTRLLRVHNTSATSGTLTINDDSNRTFTGVLGSDGIIGTFDPASGNNFSVVKNGIGTWTLRLQANGGSPSNMTNNITPVNSYSGGTVLNQGGITLGDGATLGTGALQVNNNNNTTSGTDVLLTLAAGSDLTVGSLSGTIATPTSGANTATIATQNGRTFTVNQAANGTYAGEIAGGGNFALGASSTHSLTLSGTNTYSGTTTVSAGTLYVAGALTSSAVTVGASGAIGRNDNTLGGGILGNGLSIEAGGKLDLTGATLGPNSTGILSLTGGSLTLGALTFQDLLGWDWLNAAQGTYQLIGGSFSVDFGNTAYVSEATAYDFGNGRSGYFTAGSLNAVIVPEPGAALLGGLGVLVLLRRRRVCGAV